MISLGAITISIASYCVCAFVVYRQYLKKKKGGSTMLYETTNEVKWHHIVDEEAEVTKSNAVSWYIDFKGFKDA